MIPSQKKIEILVRGLHGSFGRQTIKPAMHYIKLAWYAFMTSVIIDRRANTLFVQHKKKQCWPRRQHSFLCWRPYNSFTASQVQHGSQPAPVVHPPTWVLAYQKPVAGFSPQVFPHPHHPFTQVNLAPPPPSIFFGSPSLSIRLPRSLEWLLTGVWHSATARGGQGQGKVLAGCHEGSVLYDIRPQQGAVSALNKLLTGWYWNTPARPAVFGPPTLVFFRKPKT